MRLLEPDDFSLDLHRIIYEVMLVLDANNDFIDYINLLRNFSVTGR